MMIAEVKLVAFVAGCFLFTKTSGLKGECANFRADIVMVIDTSTSVGWKLLLEFVVRVVEHLNIDAGHVRIGAVEFATSANSVFHLNRYSNATLLTNAIRKVPYLTGDTNTSAGISAMHHTEFRLENGDRPDVQNIGIVMLDGASNSEGDEITKAVAARRAGIQIYVVGITESVNEVNVRLMASQPQMKDGNFFLAKDFSSLTTVADNLVLTMCKKLAEAVLDPPVTKAVSLRLHDSNYWTCVAVADLDHYTFVASQHRWMPEPPSTCWTPGLTISMGAPDNTKTSLIVSIVGLHLTCSTSHFEVAMQEKQWSTCGLAGTYATCTWGHLMRLRGGFNRCVATCRCERGDCKQVTIHIPKLFQDWWICEILIT